MPVTQLPPLRAFSRSQAEVLRDDELIAEQQAFAAARRLLDAGAAAVAAEIAHRSRRELGSDGLAQSRGMRTPENLVAQVTGLSTRDARTLVTVGTLISDPDPWLASVADAVTTGGLSLEGADVIRAGLGGTGAGDADRVAPEELATAATRLVDEAPGLTLEQLARRARAARATLDTAGVPAREEELRQRRFLTLTPQPDGMTRVSGLLDPESAAIITTALDAITAPRRGGPRFVDTSTETPTVVGPTDDDDRTVPQLMADALVDAITLATLADRTGNTTRLFGQGRIGVRVHVAHRDLATGTGYAHLEGQTTPVSVTTATRIACNGGLVPIVIDDTGQPLNVGRHQRLHTPAMRIAMAARDGGCVMPDCNRPPHWCEAHHTNEWHNDHGNTSVTDGVLLCRHHHLLLHNKGWRITRDGSTYWLVKPDGTHTRLQHNNPIAERIHPC
jgi:hypothetical protein